MKLTTVLSLALASRHLFAAAAPTEAKLPSPMYAKIRLISGSGDPAFRDGNFIKAAFKGPRGMAVSGDGKTLYVADSGNKAIRSVHLDLQNSVETPCKDLSNPTDLVLSTDQTSLFIYDRGSRKILLLDLAKKTVHTAISLSATPDKGTESIGLGLTAGGKVVFVDPVESSLMLGDPKTGLAQAIFKDPTFAEAGIKLVFSKDKLRCYSPAQHTVLEFTADARKVDSALLDSWTSGMVFTKLHKMEISGGLVGFTSLSPLAHPGVLAWDPAEANIQIYDNVNENSRAFKISMKDYLTLDRSIGPNKAPYFRGPLSLAYDYDRQVVYVSQYDSNQISAVRDESRGAEKYVFRHNHDFCALKPVGITRVLIFGSSLMFGSWEPENPGEFIPSQFELYLNLLSSLQGNGKQYEVLYDIQQGLKNSGGEVTLLEHPGLLKDYNFDYVVFAVNEQSVWFDVNAWAEVPTEDDVPLKSLDPEWAAKDIKEKAASMGPSLKKMVAYCKENPKECSEFMSFFPGGEPDLHFSCGTSMSFLQNPRLRELSFDIEKKLAAKAVNLCRKSEVKPVAIIVPNKGYFGGGERDITCRIFDGELAEAQRAMMESQGMPATNMLDLMRTVQPEVFPLWIESDFHFLHRGQQWMGYLMATKFLEAVNRP